MKKAVKRQELVDNRKAQLEKLTDLELLQTVVGYFRNNHTMPGEKALKDCAEGLLAEFDGEAVTGLLSQLRGDLIEQFASVCVKTTKLRLVQAADDTKANRKAGVKLVSGLQMVLADSYVETVRTADGTTRAANRDVYVLPGTICFPDGLVYVRDKDAEDAMLTFNMGSIMEGFRKNHYSENPVNCVIEGTDYSEGKLANMGWQMHVDLAAAV